MTESPSCVRCGIPCKLLRFEGGTWKCCVCLKIADECEACLRETSGLIYRLRSPICSDCPLSCQILQSTLEMSILKCCLCCGRRIKCQPCIEHHEHRPRFYPIKVTSYN